MNTKADLSVIIVTYNNQRTIEDCLDSLLRLEYDLEIVVVDNHSLDQTVKLLRQYSSRIKVLTLEENLGFGRGCNLGVTISTADYLLFLNPDTKLITKNGLHQLLKTLQSKPKLGAVGGQLTHVDGTVQLTVRNLPTVWRAVEEFIFQRPGAYEFYLPSGAEPIKVESVVGACLLISRKLFNRVGGFDLRYFLYFEDLELCRQIALRGLAVGYCPSVRLSHIEGESGRGSSKINSLSVKAAKIYLGPFGYWLVSLIGRVGHFIYG